MPESLEDLVLFLKEHGSQTDRELKELGYDIKEINKSNIPRVYLAPKSALARSLLINGVLYYSGGQEEDVGHKIGQNLPRDITRQSRVTLTCYFKNVLPNKVFIVVGLYYSSTHGICELNHNNPRLFKLLKDESYVESNGTRSWCWTEKGLRVLKKVEENKRAYKC